MMSNVNTETCLQFSDGEKEKMVKKVVRHENKTKE